MSDPIPEHLERTCTMLNKAFPAGIGKEEYYPLLALLYEHLTDRNLAEVIVIVTGKDSAAAHNDVHRSVTTNRPGQESLDLVIEKLMPHGYEAWLNEE
ncbi:DUF3349 domain-containing protein [Paenibacillus oleatilyticus]|uniref:DUF3349 domain-containing protein n=1 Tax=Paenibacillus oleatilyticus TaxID=2594886 RepID=A0ABV4UUL0_9BACL